MLEGKVDLAKRSDDSLEVERTPIPATVQTLGANTKSVTTDLLSDWHIVKVSLIVQLT